MLDFEMIFGKYMFPEAPLPETTLHIQSLGARQFVRFDSKKRTPRSGIISA
jgi:hypothetical protein